MNKIIHEKNKIVMEFGLTVIRAVVFFFILFKKIRINLFVKYVLLNSGYILMNKGV
jgi:hypothetical protein